jgi:hypothetical protein
VRIENLTGVSIAAQDRLDTSVKNDARPVTPRKRSFFNEQRPAAAAVSIETFDVKESDHDDQP